jgi:hypothetical protein
MRRRAGFVLALIVWLPGADLAAQSAPNVPSAPPARPGRPAPASVVAEIKQALNAATGRFDAMDLAGVLVHVSEQYRTTDLTKAGIADQLRLVFSLHDQVSARVHLDEVRMVGELAWIYSTGRVTGRLRYLGGDILIASWQRELEVARRENGRWRLYGYQR